MHTHSFIYFMYVCVSESEPPLSDQSEQFSDPGLISLLRAELGLSSSDLFSMTVTDYDIKPSVRQSSLNFVFWSFYFYILVFSTTHVHTWKQSSLQLLRVMRTIFTSSAKTCSSQCKSQLFFQTCMTKLVPSFHLFVKSKIIQHHLVREVLQRFFLIIQL